MRRVLLACAVLLAVCSWPGPATPAAGRTYRVSPAGDDAGPGTAERPLRTIQRGIDLAGPGDTVLVLDGTYVAESFPMVRIDRGGLPGARITLAAAPGAAPLLTGSAQWRYGIVVAPEASFVTIAGLALRGFAADAVQLDCQACADAVEHRAIRLARLEISGGGTGLRIANGARVAVVGSWLHDNAEVGIDCAPGPCNRLRVERTRLERHDGYDWSDGLAVERGRGISIVDSVARDNAGDGFDSKAYDTTVLRSAAIGNARDGIKLWRGDSAIRDSIAARNGLTSVVLESGGTFTVASTLLADGGAVARSYAMTVAYDGGPATALRLFDTIFSGTDGTALYLGAPVTLEREDHDLFDTGAAENDAIVYRGTAYSEADLDDGTWQRASGLGAGTFSAVPAFAGGEDYRLQTGSPGVDDGTAQGASATAIDGTPRPQGAATDIGPYER